MTKTRRQFSPEEKHLLVHPTEGMVSMVDWLKEKGYPVGPKRIRRLFKLIGNQTLYRRKNLTKGSAREFIITYLLKGLKVTLANQVWFTDITYIPTTNGLLYMTAFINVYSRKIVGWGISNSMTKQWCLEVLKAAIGRHGKPEILNSDQGSQYSSLGWINYPEDNQIRVTMDGKGRATDNAWIELLWKSLKYNYIHLNPCDSGLEVFEAVQRYIEYYFWKKHQTIKMSPNTAFDQSIGNKAA